jgi:hypothetical protein
MSDNELNEAEDFIFKQAAEISALRTRAETAERERDELRWLCDAWQRVMRGEAEDVIKRCNTEKDTMAHNYGYVLAETAINAIRALPIKDHP